MVTLWCEIYCNVLDSTQHQYEAHRDQYGTSLWNLYTCLRRSVVIHWQWITRILHPITYIYRMGWYRMIHSESSFAYMGHPQECVVSIAVGLLIPDTIMLVNQAIDSITSLTIISHKFSYIWSWKCSGQNNDDWYSWTAGRGLRVNKTHREDSPGSVLWKCPRDGWVLRVCP